MERRGFLKAAGIAVASAGIGSMAGIATARGSDPEPYAVGSAGVRGIPIAAAAPPLTGRTLWEFPWDDKSAGLGLDPGGEEMEVWGPSAIITSSDGVAILDQVHRRVVVCSPTGEIVQSVSLPDGQAIDDVIHTPGGWLTTNTSPENPGIMLVDEDIIKDVVLVTRELAPQMIGLVEGISGTALVCEAGQLPIKAKGFAADDNAFLRSRHPGIRLFDMANGAQVSAQADRAAGAAIAVDGSRVLLPFVNRIGEVRPIAADIASGESYLLVSELVDVDEALLVQPWLISCDKNGKLRWAARYPVEEAMYIPKTPMMVDADGNVLALVPRKEVAQVRILDRQIMPEPVPWRTIQGVVNPLGISPREAHAVQAACVSGSTMAGVASGYLNCYQYHNWTDDIAETGCDGRSKPYYMDSSGSYWSVPYKWGGFDTVSDYKDHIQANSSRAGDDTKGDTLSCAAGIDCSGFVSRCWKKAAKYSTRTLPDISYWLSSTAVTGDIYNKYNDHVVMVDYVSDTSGVKVWHATTGKKDRVVHEFVSWSYLSGYSRRRYDNKC